MLETKLQVLGKGRHDGQYKRVKIDTGTKGIQLVLASCRNRESTAS